MIELLKFRILRFILVGGSAFLVNWILVVCFSHYFGINPLVSNVGGFACAFIVSYLGHKNWTFVAKSQPHVTSLRRFVVVSLVGFAINEGSYALLLKFSSLNYWQDLIIALSVAAISTYFLSRHWAFSSEHSLYNEDSGDNKAILCADDFGYSEEVSKAILELCEHRKIRATTVMVESPGIEYYCSLLETHKKYIQIGLHFNLTEPPSKEVFSLCSLVLSFFLPRSQRAIIAESLTRQLDRFEALFGQPPDFVDGHQHVHVMPCVRSVFLRVLDQRYRDQKKRPWIRQVSPSLRYTDAHLKTAVLKFLNIGFRTKCKKYGFTYNDKFDGVYSLKPVANYKTLLQRWLDNSARKVIMCHPSMGCPDNEVLSQARLREYEVLRD